MPTDQSSTPAGGSSIEAILTAGVESLSSANSVVELSRQLDLTAVEKIKQIVQARISAGEPDRAEAILLATERAAQINGIDAIRYWARIGRAMVAALNQNPDRAELLYEEGFDGLDQLDELNDPSILHFYILAGESVCGRALREQKISEAREILARLLQRAIAANNVTFERLVTAKFLSLSQAIQDLVSEEAHALRLIEGPFLRDAGNFKETLVQLLQKAASDLFAAGDSKYEPARRIARAVIDETPTNGETLRILALTAFAEEDFADSLVWIDRLLEAPDKLLPNTDVTSLYQRRALCLLNLQRDQEAYESIQTALQIKPDDPYLRVSAAQMFEMIGDQKRSIEEYTETARLAEALLEKESPTASRARPQSSEEYQSNLPVQNLRDFAILHRALSLHEMGRNSEAVADLEMLVSKADDVSRANALMTLAQWAAEDGRLKDAAESLNRAKSLNSGQTDQIELQLASVLIGLRSYAEAIDLLVPLSHKSRKPELSIELLNRIPESWTDYSRVLKCRGYAKTEAGWPREGFAELNAAVAAAPSDSDALYLRALARITFGIQPDQQDWNASRNMRHIRESLDDLYNAVKLKRDDDESRRVAKWLIERAAANPEMIEIFSAGGNREGDLFKVFPKLEPALKQQWDANTLGYKRQWEECALAWNETVRLYQSAGFEIMACRTNLRVADVYLRLFDFDKVEEHLQRAEQLRFLIGVPLSRDVLDRVDQMVPKRGLYERPTLGLEVEYNWIYGYAIYDEWKLTLLQANYLHRVGDLAGALKQADELKPILNDLPRYLGFIFGITEVLWIVAILRDGGRYDEALHLLDLLQTHATETNQSFDVLYTRGLIHDVKGEAELARDTFERALAVIDTRLRPMGIAPYVQYASSLLQTGRLAQAQQVIEKIDIDDSSLSDRDRLFYYIVVAAIDEAQGAYPDALKAVEKAIPIVEGRRAEIQDPAQRRGWQGLQQNLFSLAVKAYAETGQARNAWRTLELSKARTLLDELYGQAALSPEHAVLVDDLETLEQAIRIVEQQINRDSGNEAGATLRTEAVAQLTGLLEPKFQDLLTDSSFVDRDFPALRDALTQREGDLLQKEQSLRDAASTPSGTVMNFDELVDLLKE
jgi:tetratricopeptide (TPR) repeat protein